MRALKEEALGALTDLGGFPSRPPLGQLSTVVYASSMVRVLVPTLMSHVVSVGLRLGSCPLRETTTHYVLRRGHEPLSW